MDIKDSGGKTPFAEEKQTDPGIPEHMAFRAGGRAFGNMHAGQEPPKWCPFTGDSRKYFKAFVDGSANESPESRKKVRDYINAICRECSMNETCNSDHVTLFYTQDTQDTQDTQERGPARMEEQRGTPGCMPADSLLPGYFGENVYSYSVYDLKNRRENRGISFTGLFVKNCTGTVTLVPGILPLFDPEDGLFYRIELSGLTKDALESVYRIFSEGGRPAVYVHIPGAQADECLVLKERTEIYVRGRDTKSVRPDHIVICRGIGEYVCGRGGKDHVRPGAR